MFEMTKITEMGRFKKGRGKEWREKVERKRKKEISWKMEKKEKLGKKKKKQFWKPPPRKNKRIKEGRPRSW